MSSRMPPELIDQVIDFLWESQSDLRACSMVCSQWLPSSRHHLFESITVRPDGRLLTLLQSPSNVVQIHTRTLDLRLWPLAATVITSQILPHFSDISRMRTLVIGSFSPPHQNFPLLCQVTKLSLQHTKFASCSDFACFLSKFAALRELELQWVTWADAGDGVRPCLALELESLSIQGFQQNPDILSWFSCPDHAPRTRGLSLYLPNNADLTTLGVLSRFIHQLDGDLRNLHLDVYPSPYLQRKLVCHIRSLSAFDSSQSRDLLAPRARRPHKSATTTDRPRRVLLPARRYMQGLPASPRTFLSLRAEKSTGRANFRRRHYLGCTGAYLRFVLRTISSPFRF